MQLEQIERDQPLKSHYREDKAIEVASRLLSKEGGKMNYTKLIKLMYLIERDALLRWGFPVTCDDYYSLDCGPILSNTLDNITGSTYCDHPSKDWESHIVRDDQYHVRLKASSPEKKLSRAEIKLIDDIYDKYGQMTWRELIEWSHDKKNIPEWENPKGSRLPISIKAILKEAQFPDDEVDNILEEIETSQSIRERLAG
jgi:hypothetical protein